MAACALPAADGMVVQTESPKVVRSRKMVVELLLSSGRHDCVTCAGAGECRLQELALRYGVVGRAVPADAAALRARDREPLHHAQLLQVHPLRPLRAGLQRRAGQRRDPLRLPRQARARSSPARTCHTRTASASSAASACRPARPTRWCSRTPTSRSGPGGAAGAHHLPLLRRRLPALAARQGQPDRQGQRRRGDAARTTGSLCVKGRFGFDFVDHPDRLTTPADPRGARASARPRWDEALDLVAEQARRDRAAHGPRRGRLPRPRPRPPTRRTTCCRSSRAR